MNPTQTTPVLGLDIGTSHVVLARNTEPAFQYDRQLNAFVTIPFSKLAQDQLRKEKIAHSVLGSEIIVYGNDSARLAELFHVETRRPMMHGVLNPDEANAMLVIREIIGRLLGPAKKDAQPIYFSVPAPALNGSGDITFHEATLRQTLKELGYEAKSISEGLAVVYAELADTNYSGIGISCGGGLCNICLAYLSVPVMHFSVPKGGDHIDSNAASATRELANSIRIAKEKTFRFNGYCGDKIQHAIQVYYDDLIQTLVQSLAQALAGQSRLPRMEQPVPLVLSGGTALPGGFKEVFERALQACKLPIVVSEVRMASEPLYSTAKGTLVAALCEM